MLPAGFRAPLAALSICLLMLARPVAAGQLSDELDSLVSARNAADKIAVWIKLPRAEDYRQFKARIFSENDTRAGQHRAAMEHLQRVHGERQQAAAGYLRRLEAQGEADSIRTRWLANLIEARVAAGQLRALAARGDIELITAVPRLELIEPEPSPDATLSPDAVQSNLSFIKANQAWQAGYTGAGRLICSFDTGVDGDHPALMNSWKGNDGDFGAAWFDPAYDEPLPHVVDGDTHGTHVMGILVGHNDLTSDTTGVALDAQWISAAVIDIWGAPILDAFEWAAEPDGDMNTVDDVPDVINHSWGIKDASCIDVFYDMIDNLEVMGIVNIFAAGNEGAVVSSVRNPADRALDSLDCFAVGNVNHVPVPPVIADNSSRGPSPCTGGIKPNVCAPGSAIRSTLPNNTYGYAGGTSMAAPHVSGLVALLRQKNPNATADQIKAAILTTAADYVYALPDNNYGWGMIDCMAALNALPSPAATPNLRVCGFNHAPIAAGDTVTGLVALQNRGGAVNNVVGTITGTDPSLIVLDGSATFGLIPAADTGWSFDAVTVVVRDTVSDGTLLSLDFQITGTGYGTTGKLYFLVEPATERLQADLTANNAWWTLTNFGTYGLDNYSIFPHNGLGFQMYSDGASQTFESALLIGLNSTQISDGARNAAGEPDGDFRVAPGGNLVVSTPGAVSAQESYAAFDDSRAENPIGIHVVQQTFAFTEPAYDDFIILRYILTNQSGVARNGLRVGLNFDWDVTAWFSNAGGWTAGDSLLWTAYDSSGVVLRYRGLKLVDGAVASAFTADASLTTYYVPDPGDGWTETEKLAALLSGFTTADTFKTASLDLMQVLTAGPINLAAGQSDTVAFAIVGGETYGAFAANAQAASAVYDSVIASCCIGLRGNVNGDPQDLYNITDVTYLVAFLFRGGADPVCPEEANINGSADGSVSIVDLTYLIATLFRGGPAPVSCGVTVP